MDDGASLGKVSSSTESVATVTSEEFVLVQSGAAGSPQGSGGKPRLKVTFRDFYTRHTRSPTAQYNPKESHVGATGCEKVKQKCLWLLSDQV